MPWIIIVVALIAVIIAMAVLSFVVHTLLSPWLILVAIGILAWIKFRPRGTRH
jgi:hypothetical protein